MRKCMFTFYGSCVFLGFPSVTKSAPKYGSLRIAGVGIKL